jgi:16S rRNA (guanine527-N7)-methyltransferase
MDVSGTGFELNVRLAEAGLEPLDEQTLSRFCDYISLYLRWNARLNLSAIRDEKEIVSRHFIEAIALARALPHGISTLLDFGSGAGIPGIPIALCCPKIAVTLAESQGKKAAFLEEAVRLLGIRATVHAQRAEALRAVFDCVVLRAVDKMPKAVVAAVRLVDPQGYLALMTTTNQLDKLKAAAGAGFCWSAPISLPASRDRLLALGAYSLNPTSK